MKFIGSLVLYFFFFFLVEKQKYLESMLRSLTKIIP